MAATPDRPILGRDAELERLDRAIGLSVGGHAAAIAISGEPGIGKTRLLAEIVRRAEARGCVVVQGLAAEFDRDVPFAIMVDAFDAHLALHEEVLDGVDEDTIAELATLFPALSHLRRAGAAALADDRHRAHRVVRTLLERAGGGKPLVIVLDDVQWADPATIELCGALLRRPPRAGALICFAFRSGQASESLQRALAAPGIRHLALGPLDAESAGKLLGDRVPPRLGEQVAREAGGNPFFLEQLARAAASGRMRDVRAPGALTAAGEGIAVPAAVAAAISEEVTSLPPDARKLVEAAAVAGDPFDLDVVLPVAGLDTHAGLDALDVLLEVGTFKQTDVPRRFLFRHPLVRRAVYDRTSGGRRLAAHAAVAAAMERLGAPVAARAPHAEQAAGPGDEQAITLLMEAAGQAMGRAPEIAARWFDAALRLLTPQDGDRRRMLLYASASALRAGGDLRGARDRLLRALEELERDGHAGFERLRTIASIASTEHWLGDHAAARARLEGALTDLDDPRGTASIVLRTVLASNGLHTLELERSLALAQAAQADAAALPSRRLEAAAAACVSLLATCAGELTVARSAADRSAALLALLTDEEMASYPEALHELAWSEAWLERWPEALAHLQRGLDVARLRAQGSLFVPLVLAQVHPLAMTGRLAEAISACEEAVASSDLTANPHYRFWARWELALTKCRVGDADGAVRLAEEALELAGTPSANSAGIGGEPGWTLGIALVAAGQPQRGREMLLAGVGGQELTAIAPVLWAGAWAGLADAERACGDLDAAQRYVTMAVEHAETKLSALAVPATVAHNAAAAVALARGDAATAVQHARTASDRAATVGAHLLDAIARARLGAALAAAGERDEAVRVLRAAEVDLAGMGALRDRDEVRRELRKLGVRVEMRPSPASLLAARESDVLAELTVREREIAELVCDRHTNREAAEKLVLSEKTIETHLRNVFAKLGASSRKDVARMVDQARAASRSGPAAT